MYIYIDGFVRSMAKQRLGEHVATYATILRRGSFRVRAWAIVTQCMCGDVTQQCVWSRDMYFLWFTVTLHNNSGHVTCFL
jgi:hypothetical protein